MGERRDPSNRRRTDRNRAYRQGDVGCSASLRTDVEQSTIDNPVVLGCETAWRGTRSPTLSQAHRASDYQPLPRSGSRDLDEGAIRSPQGDGRPCPPPAPAQRGPNAGGDARAPRRRPTQPQAARSRSTNALSLTADRCTCVCSSPSGSASSYADVHDRRSVKAAGPTRRRCRAGARRSQGGAPPLQSPRGGAYRPRARPWVKRPSPPLVCPVRCRLARPRPTTARP
jgi:hypothetical protein